MAARHFALARRGVALQPLRPGPHRRRTGEACLRPLPPRGRKPKPRNRMWPVPRYSHHRHSHTRGACGPALAPRTGRQESTRTACSGPMARAGPCYAPSASIEARRDSYGVSCTPVGFSRGIMNGIFRGYRALMDLGSNSGLCLPAEAGLGPLRILAVFWNPGRL